MQLDSMEVIFDLSIIIKEGHVLTAERDVLRQEGIALIMMDVPRSFMVLLRVTIKSSSNMHMTEFVIFLQR